MKVILKISFFFCLSVFLIVLKTYAQFKINGTVYDSTGVYPLEAVSVLSTSGIGTATDVNGNYEISVSENDSVWFSYLGKPTIKFPVSKIWSPSHFDISLQVSILVLKGVKVKTRNYREDSIQNRHDYAKGFNYRKPTFGSVVTSISITGFTVDIDELIRVFQYRKKYNALKFRERLLQEEKDKFIDQRFNKYLVRKITSFEGNELDTFMLIHRPTYEFTLYASDYDLQEYIKQEYEKYKAASGELRKLE